MALFIFTCIYRVIVHISLPIIGNTLTPLFRTLHKPDGILLFFSCGTKFHTEFNVQVTWPITVHQIRQSADHRASIG